MDICMPGPLLDIFVWERRVRSRVWTQVKTRGMLGVASDCDCGVGDCGVVAVVAAE